jgi:predicted small lipoprotein YifL
MRKLFGILITIVIVFSLVGCGKSADAPKKDPAPKHHTAKKSDQLSDKEKAIAVAKEYMADIYTQDYRNPASFTKGNELLIPKLQKVISSQRLDLQNEFTKDKQYNTYNAITAKIVKVEGNIFTININLSGKAIWKEKGQRKSQNGTAKGTIVVTKQSDGKFLISSISYDAKASN